MADGQSADCPPKSAWDRVGQGFVLVDPAHSSLTRDEVLPGARAGAVVAGLAYAIDRERFEPDG